MLPLLAILALSLPLAARPVAIAWDAAPPLENVVGWRIWRGIDLIGSSNVPSATVQIGNEATTITATAINAAGESAHSDPLTIPPPMVWLQRSPDLMTWADVVQVVYQPNQIPRIEIIGEATWIQMSIDRKPFTNVIEIPFIKPSQYIRIQLPPP